MFLFFWIPKAISGMGVSVLNNIVFLLLFFWCVLWLHFIKVNPELFWKSVHCVHFIPASNLTSFSVSVWPTVRLSDFFALVLSIFLFTVAKIVYFFLVVLKSSFLQVKFVCLTVILLSILAIITAFKSKIPLFTIISGFFKMLWFCCPAAPPSVRLDFGLGSGVDGIMRLVLKSLESLAVLFFFIWSWLVWPAKKDNRPPDEVALKKRTCAFVSIHPLDT